MVVLGEGSFSFEDLDGDGGLLVLVGSEGLGFLAWDDSTSVDDLSHNTSNSLNTEGKWGNIDQKNILGLL